MSLGPVHRTIFPYTFHFSSINTHLLVPKPLGGEIAADKLMIFKALAAGNCFVGYDLPASTRGFRFSAQNHDHTSIMGEEIKAEGGVTLQVTFPRQSFEAFLLRNGQVIKTTRQKDFTYTTNDPGVYRVEAYRHYLGKKRGWIFSNPIYIK
jgi:hypothetical protein